MEGATDGLAASPAQPHGCRRRQREISRQLTQLVDVVYGVVLVQGAIEYRSLFTHPHEFFETSLWVPVTLALVLIYFTTIQSFVDYHLAAENQPYQLLNRGRRGADLARFYLDIMIVGSYSFLLLKCHVLLDRPASDLTPVFIALPGIFVLYLAWGWLRKATAGSGSQSYNECLLLCTLATYGALAVAYTQLVAIDPLANSVFLAIACLLMTLYRRLNWPQNRPCE